MKPQILFHRPHEVELLITTKTPALLITDDGEVTEDEMPKNAG
jgi:hypothetical protein